MTRAIEDTLVVQSAEYVVQTPEGGWRIAGTRVSLDSLVHAYWEGQSPEAIAEEFATLDLEKIHGAIAYYLHNRATIHEYLARQDSCWEHLRRDSEAKHSPLLKRIREAQPTP
jgi:uncharacterized protein (DUF433 family)